MSARDWQDDDDQQPVKTRADYRREQEEAGRDFAERDKKRVAVERRYARDHPDTEPSNDERPDDPREAAEGPTKQQRLKRRLNWAIFWLALGIIIVYLILFFVEF